MLTRDLTAVHRPASWSTPFVISLALGVMTGGCVYGGVTLAVWLASTV